MTISRFIRYFVLLVLSCAAVAFSANGGSAYSRYWLGDLAYFPTSRAMGMGGASIAVLSSNSIDRLNPAAWSRIYSTRFSFSLLYEGFSASDNSQSAFLSSADFNGFMLAIPISVPAGVVFGAGITPFSKVNYNITTPASPGSLDYTTQYLGSGGVSLGHVGLSANVGPDLSIGSKCNYYFGTLHHTISQSFTSSQYTNSSVDRALELKGIGFTFGAVYSGLRKVLGLAETKSLNVGVVFTTTSQLKAVDQRFSTFSTSLLTTRDTIMSDEGRVHLPYALGGGMSYLSDRLLLAGDVYYQRWKDYDARGIDLSEIRDSYRFSAGCEILPKRDVALPFLQRIAYRAGVFYNETYYRIKGEDINEMGVSGGFGIPILRETILNIAAQYSFRGTTNQQLQRDRILRILFTLSGGEPWFVRTEEE